MGRVDQSAAAAAAPAAPGGATAAAADSAVAYAGYAFHTSHAEAEGGIAEQRPALSAPAAANGATHTTGMDGQPLGTASCPAAVLTYMLMRLTSSYGCFPSVTPEVVLTR